MNVCEGTNERPRDANVGTRERWVTFLPRVMKMEINGSSGSGGGGSGRGHREEGSGDWE